MNEYNPNVTLEDLLEQEEETFGNVPVNLATGIGGNVEPDVTRTIDNDPNAVRWVFNPFEIVDVSNKPASSGFIFLRNVIFNKVKSLKINVGKSYDDSNFDPLNPMHSDGNYDKFDRTAHMISRELEEHYGDKGVVEISELTGQDDDTAANLNVLLFGTEVVCVVDPNNTEHPCPVLPNLLETLEANVRANVAGLDAETKATVIAVATRLRTSIGTALKNCRTRIDYAQKRILDEKDPNRTLAPAEQRCYLALGEEIPNVMPFTTRSNSMGLNQPQTAGIDSEALGRGIAAGLASAGITPTPAIVEQAKTVAETVHVPTSDFSVTEDDIAENATSDEEANQAMGVKMCAALTGKGQPCKNKAEPDSDFCKVPAHQATK